MKKYKVVWEERRSVIVKAKNEIEAAEKVMFEDWDKETISEEITMQPEAYFVKE